MRRPNFFIVGAAKSGTTSMLRYLAQHPDIAMPQRREPIYFGSDLTSHRKKVPSVDEYLGIFSGAGPEKVVGEKSVWYLYSQSAAEEIKAFDRNAKIMIMLRNPIDMIHSLHQQFVSTGNETVASFDDAIGLVEERALGRNLPRGAHFSEGLLYTRIPLYCDQVERYLRAFGRDRVHVVSFDDFSKDTRASYAETLAFLDVNQDFTPDFVVYNKKNLPRRKWLNDLTSDPSSPLMALPKRLREPLSWRLEKFNSVDVKRAPMSSAMRVHLREVFKPEVERLSRLLDRDFTHWCEQATV